MFVAAVQHLSLLHHSAYYTVSDPRSRDKKGKKFDLLPKEQLVGLQIRSMSGLFSLFSSRSIVKMSHPSSHSVTSI